MKPSDQCKQAGLKSLAQLSEISGRSRSTLIRWAKEDPDFFELTLSGAVLKTIVCKDLPPILIEQNA